MRVFLSLLFLSLSSTKNKNKKKLQKPTHLRQRVVRGTFHQDSAAPRRGDVLNESVLLLPQGVLKDQAGASQDFRRRQLLDRVHRHAAAGQHEPLHVAPLGAAQGQDAVFGQRVQRERVDSFLVDEDEAASFAAVGAADPFLEVDDLLDALVGRRLEAV